MNLRQKADHLIYIYIYDHIVKFVVGRDLYIFFLVQTVFPKNFNFFWYVLDRFDALILKIILKKIKKISF